MPAGLKLDPISYTKKQPTYIHVEHIESEEAAAHPFSSKQAQVPYIALGLWAADAKHGSSDVSIFVVSSENPLWTSLKRKELSSLSGPQNRSCDSSFPPALPEV